MRKYQSFGATKKLRWQCEMCILVTAHTFKQTQHRPQLDKIMSLKPQDEKIWLTEHPCPQNTHKHTHTHPQIIFIFLHSPTFLSSCNVWHFALYTVWPCLDLPVLWYWDIIIRDRQTEKAKATERMKDMGGLQCSNSVCSVLLSVSACVCVCLCVSALKPLR